MDIELEHLDYVFAGGTALLVFGFALALFLVSRPGGPGGPQWRRYLQSHAVWLDLLASRTTPVEIVGYQLFSVGLLLATWLVFDMEYVLYVIPLVIPLTPLAFRLAYEQRCQAIALQLDGWLLMLSNMLKATGSVGSAIESSASLVRSPLKEEVELMLKQFEVGMTIEDGLASMYKRVPSKGLHTVVTSLRVGRRLGGDLPTLLAENAATLRETERIDGFIRSQVSQGKAQMLVLALAPLGLIYMFIRITPDFFDPLLNHILGPYIIIGCVCMWVTAIIVGLKIMNVDA